MIIKMRCCLVAAMFLLLTCGSCVEVAKLDRTVKTHQLVAGIWVIDKDKIQMENENLLKQASIKANELATELAKKQLKQLEKSNQQRLELFAPMMYEFNEDGSGGFFTNLAELKGVRGRLEGAGYPFLWKEEGGKVKLDLYGPAKNSILGEWEYILVGDSLVLSGPKREVKPDETNVYNLFDLRKWYFRKVRSGDKAARKVKVIVLEEVKLAAIPEGFAMGGFRAGSGFGPGSRKYINISDEAENIRFLFPIGWKLAVYNRPGEIKATHDDVIKILQKEMHEEFLKKFPEAKLSTGFATLDGTKSGYVEGLLDENHEYMKGPFYIKEYVLVDEGTVILKIRISTRSTERIKFMDGYVKKIKLNMKKTWVITMEDVVESMKSEELRKRKVESIKRENAKSLMENKRKSEELMKRNNVK